MKKLYFLFTSIFLTTGFSQQLVNSNLETWTTQSYGAEPSNWQYPNGSVLVFGTNNIIRSWNGVDPLTTTKVTGSNAFGGSGNSVLLETKAAIGNQAISQGILTIPGNLYREDAISNSNIGSITFKYKAQVVAGDSCFVKVRLVDANYADISSGIFWIKPINNSLSQWTTKTIFLNNYSSLTPTKIILEAMSTYDEAYSYTTPILGSKLYLDNFVLNYCNSPIVSNVSQTICDYMLPFTWNGMTFNSAGSLSANLSSSFGCDSTVNMNLNVINGPYTLVPDIGFETYLGQIGLDPCGIDGKVPTSLVNTITSLSIGANSSVPQISILKGIEDFTALEVLKITRGTSSTSNGVYITNSSGFDLSQNINLKKLTCQGCNLQELNLNANINLETLDLGLWSFPPTLPLNNISSLNLSSNSLLKSIIVSYANIQNLNLPQSSNLSTIDASQNSISSIDFSNVTGLERINLSNNNLDYIVGNNNPQLKSLNLANNSSLTSLPSSAINADTIRVKGCGFSGLNFTNFQNLKFLDCSNNNLECLTVKVSPNNQISYINTINNFGLTCIEVNDSIFSTNNPVWNSNKDPWSVYSLDCPGICLTASLDANVLEDVRFYPNPTNGLIQVNSTSPIEEISLLSTNGTILGITQSNSIDLTNYSSGMYLLSVRFTNGFIKTQQIIKK